MNPSAAFIGRPIGTGLLMAAMLLLGLAAYPLLPVAPLPQVDFPTIQVTATLPGASPETMASNVATPLERQFSLIASMTQMTSLSALGSTAITLQFDLSRNIDAAAQDVLAAINAATGQLPTNLPSPPTYRKINPADPPILVFGLSSESLPLTTVDDAADTILAQRLSQISGVAQVQIGGQQKPAVRIQIDPDRIAALGIGLEDIRAQIVLASVNAPKGVLDGPDQSFTVYDNDQLLAAEPWNAEIVAYRNGAPVRVRDIGRAIAAPENTKLAAWAADAQGRRRVVTLAVFKQPGANIIKTVDLVRAALPRLQAAIPAGVDLQLLTDRTQTIRASVADVERTLLLTIALVVLVIFVFLRSVWATVIPSVTVPLALVGTCAGMYLLGYSIDNLSLMGLTIAVGFVVDDAIVMLENIVRYVEDGTPPMEAALKGAGEIGFTIVAISLSLIAVFIPLLLMGGIVGRLLQEFAVVVTLTVVLSVAVSLTLTPMMCAYLLRSEKQASRGRLYQWSERMFAGLLDGYERALRWVLRHQRLTLGVFTATLLSTGALFYVIPKGFFPQQDTGFIFGIAEGAEDVSSAAMWRRIAAVSEVVAHDADVSALSIIAGGSTFNSATMFINLKPQNQRTASADQIIARLRPQIAAIEGVNLYLQAAQDINVGGRLSRTQYQYTLQDADLAELNLWAPRLLDKLRTLPELADLATDQQANGATATLTIDRDAAARFGIQPALIDATIYDAIGQRQVAQYFTQLNAYHIVLEVTPALQADASLFDHLYLTSPITNRQVPLSALVHTDTTTTNYLAVSHQSQYAAITLSYNLAPGVALGTAVTAITKAQRELGMPSTVTGAFQGSAQSFQSSLASEPYLIAAALISVYVILGVLYESLVHPITILSTLPSAGLGALLALMAGGYDLSVIAMIGILLLIGIVKKNGIMIVDFALKGERQQGLDPEEAIYQACKLRFRPIMMTTLCALLAGLPLMLGSGTGSELRKPLGYAMVGGLIVSQALTLFTTPVVYLALERASRWFSRWREPAPRIGAKANLEPGV